MIQCKNQTPKKRIRKHSWIVRNPSMCVNVRLICCVQYTLHHVLCYRICKQRHKPQRIITQQIKSRKFEQQEIADCWRKIKQQNTTIAYTNWRRGVTEIVCDFFSLHFIFNNTYLLHFLSCWTKKCVDHAMAHVTHYNFIYDQLNF